MFQLELLDGQLDIKLALCLAQHFLFMVAELNNTNIVFFAELKINAKIIDIAIFQFEEFYYSVRGQFLCY